jgi:uncharacterized membrane protein
VKQNCNSSSNDAKLNFWYIFRKYLPYGLVLILIFAATGSFLGATYESHIPLTGGGESLLPADLQNHWYNFLGAGAGAIAGLVVYMLGVTLLRRFKNHLNYQ